MSADKRSTHTDALATLGTIIDETAKRDAIHLAVEPVTAGCRLRRGERIGLGRDGAAWPVSHITGHKTLGIVDPFITDFAEAGERFWLIVRPREITSLRHVWEHPEFPASEAMAAAPAVSITMLTQAAVDAIESFAETADIRNYDDEDSDSTKPYRTAMKALGHMNDSGCVPFDACGKIPNKVWDAYEVLTGQTVTERHEYFSCGC